MRKPLWARSRISTRSFRRMVVPITVGLVVSMAMPASAGIGEGNGEVGFDIGWTEFDSNVTDDSGGRLVIRGGYHLTDLVELEGHYASSVTDELIGDVTLTTLFLDAVFNFRPSDEIVPYVLVGVGGANLDYDLVLFVGNVDDSSAAFQAAGGSRFFFGSRKKIAARVELSVMTEDTFDESSTHVNLAAGLTWRIGN